MARKGTFPAAAVLAVALAVAAAAIVVVLFVSAKKRSNYELCRGNLISLAIALRGGELLDSPRWDEVPRGRAFLADPSRWPMRQRFEIDLSCPVLGEGREIDYRGPARPLREIRPDQPLCADRPGNHGPGRGGNVMRKSGEVVSVGENDPLWAQAAETTSD